MVLNKAMIHRNINDNWNTPPHILTFVHTMFLEYGGIQLDPCASLYSPTVEAKQKEYKNGLTIPWLPGTFCNPPYSENTLWIQKAINEFTKGIDILLLLPANTDVRWWHLLADFPVCFVKGRIHFIPGDPDLPNNHRPQNASAMFYLGHDVYRFHKVFSILGDVRVPFSRVIGYDTGHRTCDVCKERQWYERTEQAIVS